MKILIAASLGSNFTGSYQKKSVDAVARNIVKVGRPSGTVIQFSLNQLVNIVYQGNSDTAMLLPRSRVISEILARLRTMYSHKNQSTDLHFFSQIILVKNVVTQFF